MWTCWRPAAASSGRCAAVVRQLARRVAVMYLGKLVEVADRDRLFSAPAHPYAEALLSAVPVPDPEGRERRRRRIVFSERPEAPG